MQELCMHRVSGRHDGSSCTFIDHSSTVPMYAGYRTQILNLIFFFADEATWTTVAYLYIVLLCFCVSVGVCVSERAVFTDPFRDTDVKESASVSWCRVVVADK